jgi:hypothetical protein
VATDTNRWETRGRAEGLHRAYGVEYPNVDPFYATFALAAAARVEVLQQQAASSAQPPVRTAEGDACAYPFKLLNRTPPRPGGVQSVTLVPDGPSATAFLGRLGWGGGDLNIPVELLFPKENATPDRCGHCDKMAKGLSRSNWTGKPAYTTTCGEFPCPGVDAPLDAKEGRHG